jgi:catechol 2,3-dioxygenase-like lactoylglutathione lyase family enzyme
VAVELTKPSLDVGIVTRDFDRMMAFYRDVLGFPVEDPAVFPGIGAVHRLRVGESVLRLMNPERPAPGSDQPNEAVHSAAGIRYITLVVRELGEVIEACRQFGVAVIGAPKEVRPGVVVATIQDPDGNWIELQTR